MKRTFKIFSISLLSLLTPLLESCALFGGGGSAEYSRARGYHVDPPAGWSETKDSGESDHAYHLSSGAIATVNSSCNRFSGQSPAVLTKQVLIGTRNVRINQRQKIQIEGQQGLHSSLTATLDGVPFHIEVIVVSVKDCVYDFQLIHPKPISEKDKADFIACAKSLSHGSN